MERNTPANLSQIYTVRSMNFSYSDLKKIPVDSFQFIRQSILLAGKLIEIIALANSKQNINKTLTVVSFILDTLHKWKTRPISCLITS